MKKTLTTLLLIASAATAALAQDRIYRCGNEYTNNAALAKDRDCKLVEGGNVTVLQSNRPAASGSSSGSAAAASAPAPYNPPPRVSQNEQKARDSDARAILEAELRKAEARHAELRKEYNDGAPQRSALELRNSQRYIERVAELKASLSRSESDVAVIKREIARLPPPSPAN